MRDHDQPSDNDLPPPPPGTQYLAAEDGTLLTDQDGTLLLVEMSEADARASVAEALKEMQAAIAEIKKQRSQIGHNNPPEPIETILADAEQISREVQGQIDRPTPDKTVLQRARAKFHALSIEAKAVAVVVVVTAAKDGAESIGHTIWAHLEPWASRLVEALAHWLATLPG